MLLSSLELLLWALPCIVVLAVLLFAECTFVSGLLCSFAFDLLLIATVPPLKFTTGYIILLPLGHPLF